eukprot:TRINITY_DN11689_c0_g1_i1.p1 TRINITY_DN11689_c0_g1~~TRINITY_DN11689_c0_g1_i1.p1  ORF type:complete len:869 (+),score=234.42 TRINITY_DN11689_c0_g1_i1:97-2703(+)
MSTLVKDKSGLLNEQHTYKIDISQLVFKNAEADGKEGTSRLILGKGAFATVELASYLGTEVAVKILTTSDPELRKYLAREVSMLRSLHHPNIVQFIGSSEDERKIYLVMEYVSRGSLRKTLKNHSIPLVWHTRVKFAVECARAIAYLHSKDVIHRDLKSKNLLIDNNMVCKVCDFGLARVMDSIKRKDKMMTIVGTDEWMAPEVTLGMDYDYKADVFSFGVVLVELITRTAIKNTFKRSVREYFAFPVEQFREVAKGIEGCPAEFAELAVACVDNEPKNRPTFLDIIKKLSDLLETLPTPKQIANIPKEVPEAVPASPLRHSSVVETPAQTSPDPSRKLTRSASAEKHNRLNDSQLLLEGEVLLQTILPVVDVSKEITTKEKESSTQNFLLANSQAASRPVSVIMSNEVHKLLISNYRVLLVVTTNDKVELVTSIPFAVIGKIEKNRAPTKQFKDLTLFCYDFKKYVFRVPKERVKQATTSIAHAKLKIEERFFAYDFKPVAAQDPIYDVQKEYERILGSVNREWRQTGVNFEYRLVPTYPKLLYVPAVSDDNLLKSLAKDPVRIPALSWRHQRKPSCLLRSSEIKWRNFEELFISNLCATNPSGQLYLVGVDVHSVKFPSNTKNSKSVEVVNLGFEDLQSVADCYGKLLSLCLDESDTKFLSSLETTKFLQSLRKCLKAASDIAETVDRGHTVLVIDKPGHDRTSELVSLAEIMLDPYYRTMRGFQVLPAKEWCSFGHPFADRILRKSDYCPIFFEFMDLVWQLWHQFRDCFEFNEHYLITILEYAQYGLFNNFSVNCEKELDAIRDKTTSMWSYLKETKGQFLNPFYQANKSNFMITPDTSSKAVVFWSDYYTEQNSKAKRKPIVK